MCYLTNPYAFCIKILLQKNNKINKNKQTNKKQQKNIMGTDVTHGAHEVVSYTDKTSRLKLDE